MNSSIPKPPQRIRVEMPAEIVPQPLPEAVLEGIIETVQPATSNTIHISHPAAPTAPIATLAPAEPEVKVAELVEEEPSLSGAINVPGDTDLYSRQYYTISEVADMFGANQSQIRYWENEFEILQPKKNKKGDRYFRPEDVKNLELIHHLLRQRRFTIEGAKEYLKHQNKRGADNHQAAIQSLEKIKSFLLEMKANLAG